MQRGYLRRAASSVTMTRSSWCLSLRRGRLVLVMVVAGGGTAGIRGATGVPPVSIVSAPLLRAMPRVPAMARVPRGMPRRVALPSGATMTAWVPVMARVVAPLDSVVGGNPRRRAQRISICQHSDQIRTGGLRRTQGSGRRGILVERAPGSGGAGGEGRQQGEDEELLHDGIPFGAGDRLRLLGRGRGRRLTGPGLKPLR